MALRRHVDLCVGRPPGHDLKRRPDLPVLVGSIKFGGTRTSYQWNSGGMPYDVVMVLERRNGPRRLRDHDDDDNNQPLTNCSPSSTVWYQEANRRAGGK